MDSIKVHPIQAMCGGTRLHPHPQEAEAGGSEIESHSQISSDFESSLHYARSTNKIDASRNVKIKAGFSSLSSISFLETDCYCFIRLFVSPLFSRYQR